ncbi:hypothetical protein GQ457_05G034250 [Hibiscus cannabinus]
MKNYHHAVLSVAGAFYLFFFLSSLFLVDVVSQNMSKMLHANCSGKFDHASLSRFQVNLNGLLVHAALRSRKGDVQPDNCQSCIQDAGNEIQRQCPYSKEAIIWNMMYATKEVKLSSSLKLYGLVQCTPDLTVPDCQSCLRSAIALAQVPNASGVKQGGKVLTPNCNIRYETYLFYGEPRDESPDTSMIEKPGAESLENEPRGTDGQTKWIAMGVTVFGVNLIFSGAVFLWRRRRYFQENEDSNSQEIKLIELGGRVDDGGSNANLHVENGVRSQEFPSIQLGILQAATKQFCDENKLGEGGFGPVYKGILPDGKEIAVKRLSRSSGQGMIEFKNEVLIIAKLQHRNLVRLLGCCLEQSETLLVYEFMPNKSLDVFLFDSASGVQLDWQNRLSIINGIARGILYLHEDSRLRIIHRDLKASNVLLDKNMNPKISDFGMARIFGGNQSVVNTECGYMAPEYAMEGLFSVKSDVFSFGVLVLEIISGKRNSGFHLWERGESLLTFSWKLWSKGQGMKLIDPLLVSSCMAAQVLRCIHVGLLCVQEDPADRPTMSSVILMLGSETTSLPPPAVPAFSVGRVVAESNQPSSNDIICSINEVTISIDQRLLV